MKNKEVLVTYHYRVSVYERKREREEGLRKRECMHSVLYLSLEQVTFPL